MAPLTSTAWPPQNGGSAQRDLQEPLRPEHDSEVTIDMAGAGDGSSVAAAPAAADGGAHSAARDLSAHRVAPTAAGSSGGGSGAAVGSSGTGAPGPVASPTDAAARAGLMHLESASHIDDSLLPRRGPLVGGAADASPGVAAAAAAAACAAAAAARPGGDPMSNGGGSGPGRDSGDGKGQAPVVVAGGDLAAQKQQQQQHHQQQQQQQQAAGGAGPLADGKGGGDGVPGCPEASRGCFGRVKGAFEVCRLLQARAHAQAGGHASRVCSRRSPRTNTTCQPNQQLIAPQNRLGLHNTHKPSTNHNHRSTRATCARARTSRCCRRC